MINTKLIALGGQDERGKNCCFLEINNNIYIFNVGVKMPINGALGVKMIAPNFDYLITNQNRIKGIFIGNPKFFNIGGIAYLLNCLNIDVNIYTSFVGKTVLESYLAKKSKFLKKQNYKIINLDPLNELKIASETFIAFRVTNYCPISYGWIIKTNKGSKIVYIDDFFISNDKTKLFQSDLNYLKKFIGNEIDWLIVGLGNVGKNIGFTSPSYKTNNYYETSINNAKGRVIIALNDYNAYNILTIANIAKSLSRPFIIYGSTFIDSFNALIKNKLFNSKNLITLPISEINNSENAIIIISDTEEDLYKKMFSILDNNIASIQFKETDTFILGTYLLPGYELHAARLLDELSRREVNIQTLPKNFTPLCASNEDHKQLINLLKPKYIFPIQGLYMNFNKYLELAVSNGIKKDCINFLSQGQSVSFEKNNLKFSNFIKNLQENYINEMGNIDSGISVVKEREQMSISGVLSVVLFLDKKNQKFLNKFDFTIVGLGSDKDNINVEEAKNKFTESINKYIHYSKNNEFIDIKQTKLAIKKGLVRIFEKKVSKTPLVVLNIIEVN